MLTFLGLGIGLTILVLLIGLVILAFEVYMFINAILNERLSSERKILWLIGMLLLHPFVAIAYYFTDYKKAA